MRADGTQVAVVRPDHTVHLQKIEVGRDYGDRLEVTGGFRKATPSSESGRRRAKA